MRRQHGLHLTAILVMVLGFALRAESQEWKTKWDKILPDAKKEGKVAVAGPPGTAYRDVMRAFEKKYPEISLEFQGFTPANFTARFSKERQAGQYLWDIYITGPTSFDVTAKKAGELDPLRAVLILPEVRGRLCKGFFGLRKTVRFRISSGDHAPSPGQPGIHSRERTEQRQGIIERQMEGQDRHR